MGRRSYERSPLNCAHPENRREGTTCGKCGQKHMPAAMPYEDRYTETSAADFSAEMAYAAANEPRREAYEEVAFSWEVAS